MAVIALIEDDALVREGTVSFLELSGHRVVAAATSADLIACLLAYGTQPDVLLCDFQLGAQTALEAVPQVVSVVDRAIPVVITTGDSSPAAKERIAELGWERLLKPYTPSELLLVLARLHQQHAA